MMWPTMIVDDFFTDPERIVKFSKTLPYNKTDGLYPGQRSEKLHLVDKAFFDWSTAKIIALLYPMQSNTKILNWKAIQMFQRVPPKVYGDAGWVHHDHFSEITSVIYLSHNKNSGTSLHKSKHFAVGPDYNEEKEDFYKTLKNKEQAELFRKKSNDKFEKTVDMQSKFNRLVMFDSHHWHQTTDHMTDDTERLTLITFFMEITGEGIRYPIPTMRRI